MKISCYNNRMDFQDKAYVFNSFSGALIEMEHERADALMSGDLHRFSVEEIKLLKGVGILVRDDCDERALVIHMFRRARYSPESLPITILPTFECNFACSYCYEKGLPSVATAPEIWEVITDFLMRSKAMYGHIDVTFYGGEPLL